MYKDKKILAVITARGGSKGIPGKNIKPLAGKPLIAYTIEAAKQSQYLTRCIVSTDAADIAAVAKEYGADVPFIRPAEFAQDKSTSMSVVQHALQWMKDAGEEYDYIMILQPTSPFRTADDIDDSITLAVDQDADSVMSMMELSDFALTKLKAIKEDGTIVPLVQEEGKQSTFRQDAKKVYKRNCAIYLTKSELIAEGDLFGTTSLAYIMPTSRSIDINEPFDFELADILMRQ